MYPSDKRMSSMTYIGGFAKGKIMCLASLLQHHTIALCTLLDHLETEIFGVLEHPPLICVIDPCGAKLDTTATRGEWYTPRLSPNPVSCLEDEDRVAGFVGGQGGLQATEAGSNDEHVEHCISCLRFMII